MMRCEHVRELLPLYVGQDVAAEDERHVLEHLNSCSDCRQEWTEYQESLSGLRGYRDEPLPAQVGRELWHGIQAEIRTSPRETRKQSGSRARMAAMFLIGIGTGFIGYMTWPVGGGAAPFDVELDRSLAREVIAEVQVQGPGAVQLTMRDRGQEPRVYRAQTVSDFEKQYPDLCHEHANLFVPDRLSGTFFEISPDGRTVTVVTFEAIDRDKNRLKSILRVFRPQDPHQFIQQYTQWQAGHDPQTGPK